MRAIRPAHIGHSAIREGDRHAAEMGCGLAHLPARRREEAADTAAARAAVRAVPYDLAGDSGLTRAQARAAATEGVGARGRKVYVIIAIADAVGGSAVAGGHAHGNAHGRSGLKSIVQRRHGLRSPCRLRAAPTDGKD